MKFQIVHSTHSQQVHIRIRGSNNEIITSGEQQHNVSDAFNTVLGMKEGAADAVVEEVFTDGSKELLWGPDVAAPVPGDD